MTKERIKSTVLIALVISSLILTSQIWFNEKLWPEGYNFFVNIRVSAFEKIASVFGLNNDDENSLQTSIVAPSCLAAYTVKDFDHAMTVLTASSENYSVINAYVSDTVSHALARDTKNITKVSESDWQKALFTRGFYVDYGIEYNTSTFAQILGINPSPFAESALSVKRFIITAEDSLVSDVSVYAADEGKSEFYKISTGLDRNSFNTNLALLTPDATPKKRFSFFINADAPAGVAGEAVFAPYLILNEETVQYHVITASNPFVRDNGVNLNMYTIERLLKAFSINSKTARKYTDAYGSVIFVQSQATLKISSDGVLSYTANGDGKGLELGRQGISQNTAAGLSAVVGLLRDVFGAVINSDGMQLYLSGLNENQNSVRASFNYMYNGTPIILGGGYEGESAVTMELEGGRLKSYKQILRRYEDSGDVTLTEPTYYAKAFSELSEDEKTNGISELFEAYFDNGKEGKKSASWFLKINGANGYKH